MPESIGKDMSGNNMDWEMEHTYLLSQLNLSSNSSYGTSYSCFLNDKNDNSIVVVMRLETTLQQTFNSWEQSQTHLVLHDCYESYHGVFFHINKEKHWEVPVPGVNTVGL